MKEVDLVSPQFIHVEPIGRIALLKLDRPPANAIDLELAEAFENTLATIEERGETDVLVITGVGNCFSAGLDLKALPAYDRARQQAMVMALNRLFGRLYGLPLPTIAAVNGHAIAGGVILTLACDYRIAAEGDYKFGLAEARVGVVYPVAAMTIVKSELAPATAKTMVLTARNYSPGAALDMGALDELQPHDCLLTRAMEVAGEMAALPRSSYRRIKRGLRAQALASIDDAISNRNEPMLDSWLSDETRSASAEALKRKE
jgi:enoyl-CoA hydratase